MEQNIIDLNSSRRIHPGTKAADMAAGPPLVPLMEVRSLLACMCAVMLMKSQLDSAFQLQEHLKALHYHHTRPSASTIVPINRQTASLIATPPFGVDRALWLYELCRFLINKCNDLIVGFLFDTPACSASTCPEMRASEWQFLCAVHESPKSCCAIDYCCHTLDWATNIVTSQKIFPSRLSLTSGDVMDDKSTGVKHLTNIFRRLHRIFAHAWFQHKGVFWQVEGQTGLYVLFKTVCDTYELLPAENYKLPPEAEGLEPAVEPKVVHTILKPDPPASSDTSTTGEDDIMRLTAAAASRNNTRRHIRSSPSTGAAVTTVIEADEEESDMAQRLRTLKIKEEEEAKQEEYEKAGESESSSHVNEEPTEEFAEMTIIVDEGTEKESEKETESAPEAAKEQEDEDKIEKDDGKPSVNASSEPESAEEKKVEEPEVQNEEAEKPQAAEDREKEPPVHTLHLDEETPAESGEGEATVTL